MRRILNRKTKSRRKSRMHSKKSSESTKSSRSRKAGTKGRAFKDNDNLLTERDKHLDQLFAETLDQDIERCKPSDQQSKKHELTDRERERIRKRILSDTDSNSALTTPDLSANTVLPSPRMRELNTFRDLLTSNWTGSRPFLSQSESNTMWI